MQLPRFVLAKVSSWCARPKVWPISWHATNCRQAGVLYCGCAKYVSFSFTVPCVMWPVLLIQICATPSHPVLPYDALQIWSCPEVGRQFLGFAAPDTTAVRTGFPKTTWLQSSDAD